jgi:hypothetical protein
VVRGAYAPVKQRCIRYHVTLDPARGSARTTLLNCDAMNLPRLSAAWLPLALFVPSMCFGQDVGVYNDRRDTSDFTSDELLGRSFIVKYTRLFDY